MMLDMSPDGPGHPNTACQNCGGTSSVLKLAGPWQFRCEDESLCRAMPVLEEMLGNVRGA